MTEFTYISNDLMYLLGIPIVIMMLISIKRIWIERKDEMKLIMYGAEICTDCVAAKGILLNREDIDLDYRNITENTKTLKEFLSYRDHEEMFRPFIEAGKIGIPFFILEDGTKTFELSDFIDVDQTESPFSINSCSIDGKGNC